MAITNAQPPRLVLKNNVGHAVAFTATGTTFHASSGTDLGALSSTTPDKLVLINDSNHLVSFTVTGTALSTTGTDLGAGTGTNFQSKLTIVDDTNNLQSFTVTGTTLNTNETPPVVTTGLVNWWKLNNSYADSFGSQTLSTLGTPTFTSTAPKEGTHALTAGSTPNYAYAPASSTTGSTAYTIQDFTVDFWIRRTVATGDGSPVMATAPAGIAAGWRLDDSSGGVTNIVLSAYYTNSSNPTSGSNLQSSSTSGILPPNDGTWAHIALVADNTAKTLKVYSDAVLKITQSYSGSGDKIAYDWGSAGQDGLGIGGYGNQPTATGKNYDYDSVKFYNIALSSTQVTQNHNAEV